MGALVPIFGQNLGLTRAWFAIQDRQLHHRVTYQIFLKDEALLQKIYIRGKWEKSYLSIVGHFLAILSNWPYLL